MTPAQLDNLLKLLTSKDRTNRELGIIMADEIEGFWEGLVIWGYADAGYLPPWTEDFEWETKRGIDPVEARRKWARRGDLRLTNGLIELDDLPF